MKLLELLESFNTKTRMHLVKSNPYKYVLKGSVGGRDIVVDFHKDADGMWQVSFYEVQDGDDVFTKTGSGSEMQVFAFVIDCINEFTLDMDPKSFEFSASKTEPSRVKLYHRIANSNLFGRYKLVDIKELRHDMCFVFSKS